MPAHPNFMVHRAPSAISTGRSSGGSALRATLQMEREQIGERTRAALAYKRERGERLGTTPLGFRTPAPGATLEPVEGELAPVRHILRRRREGATFRTIAAELTSQGLPTKRGARWHETTVRRLWRGRARYAALLTA